MKIYLKKVQYLMSIVMLISLHCTINASSSAARASRLLAAQVSKSGVNSAAKTTPVINPMLTSSRSLTSNTPKLKVQQQSFSTNIPKDGHTAGAKSIFSKMDESISKMSMSKQVGVMAAIFAAEALIISGINNVYQSIKDAILPIDMQSKPNFKQAVSFLKTKFKKMQLSSDVDIEYLAHLFTRYGLTYVKINTIIDSAQIVYASQKDRSMITMHDINNAFKDEHSGQIEGEYKGFDRLNSSWHEAGHSLISVLGLSDIRRVHEASVGRRGDSAGLMYSFSLKQLLTFPGIREIQEIKQQIQLDKKEVCQLLAGGVAENLLSKADVLGTYKDKAGYLDKGYKSLDTKEFDYDEFIQRAGLKGDMKKAQIIIDRIVRREIFIKRLLTNIVTKSIPEDTESIDESQDQQDKDEKEIEVEKIRMMAYLIRCTMGILEQHQDQLKEIADVIYEEGSISGQRVYEIVGQDAPMLHFEHDRIIDEIEGGFYDYR